MSSVELHVTNAIITLNAGGLLESGLDVLVDLTKDGDLALEDLLVGANLHFAGDIVDEAVLGCVVEHLVPQYAWGVEVLGSDAGQEADGGALEVTVGLVIVNSALAELDGVDGAQVIGTRTLIIESHRAITLEVAPLEASTVSIRSEEHTSELQSH